MIATLRKYKLTVEVDGGPPETLEFDEAKGDVFEFEIHTEFREADKTTWSPRIVKPTVNKRHITINAVQNRRR